MCQTGLISGNSKNVRNGRVSDEVRWFRSECDERTRDCLSTAAEMSTWLSIPRDFSSLFTITAGTLGKAQAQDGLKKRGASPRRYLATGSPLWTRDVC